ncbi:MAG: hypothetical protein Q7T33_02275 [Dehalococcoidia bacterium]|nr:hypothetical protein [Dehalococcoidia bacterium]
MRNANGSSTSNTPKTVIRGWVLRTTILLLVADLLIWCAWAVLLVTGTSDNTSDRLQEVAIVLLITAAITGAFEWASLGELAEQLQAQLKEAISAIVVQTKSETQELSMSISRIVDGAIGSGIVNIFPNRREPDAISAVARELRRAKGEVKIIGVGLPDFFHQRKADYYPDICVLLEGKGAKLRILILDPESPAAKERGEIERQFLTRDEINDSIRTIETLRKDDLPIEPRHYGGRPINFMVCTETYLFLEQYHCGRSSDLKPGECIGARVPLIQFSFDSRTYEVMNSHFEYLWSVGTPLRQATEAAVQ